jgi:hypothetical protein
VWPIRDTWNLTEMTEENHEILCSGEPICWPRFELSTPNHPLLLSQALSSLSFVIYLLFSLFLLHPSSWYDSYLTHILPFPRLIVSFPSLSIVLFHAFVHSTVILIPLPSSPSFSLYPYSIYSFISLPPFAIVFSNHFILRSDRLPSLHILTTSEDSLGS